MGRVAMISAARPGAMHRGDPGWKLSPIQSAPAEAQANASAGRVRPQTLIRTLASDTPS